MKLRENCQYALVCPTSMGVRITPEGRQPVQISRNYCMQATSAESNVLNIAASLGMKTKVLTVFVQDSAIAQFIKSELRFRGIEFEGREVEQEGPWGYRHQFNIADSGYGLRGPVVTNDRAGEVGKLLSLKDFDLDRLFGKEGVRILHLSGLICALSPETSQFCLELARTARKYGTVISFDLNYRDSFWKGRERELADVFREVSGLSDILIGNEEDFQLALGISGPEAGGKNISDQIESFKGMIQEAQLLFPHTQVFATTLREVISANEHMWGAIMLNDGQWFIEEPRSIPVLDRIGGGDGYVGGMLYGILKGWEPKKWVQFGWATGVLATTVLNDYATPTSEGQVWSIYTGNARIKR